MPRPAGATSGSSRTTTSAPSCASSRPGRCACCSPSGSPRSRSARRSRSRSSTPVGRCASSRPARRTSSRRSCRGCACRCATCPAPRRCSSTGTAYRGALLVHRQAGKLTIVNRLPLDRYLRGVVPWEMPDDWHREALRAQSVVARSYALATLKPGTLFDLYADTRSQVYGGIRAEAASTNRAIGSTAGRVVSWNGRVATTFYHSTSGGRTVSNEEAWPGATPVPYLVSVPDPYDGLSKLHRWGPFPWTPAEVGRKLGVGVVRDLVVTRGTVGTRGRGDDQGPRRRADDARAGLPPRARPPLHLVRRACPESRAAAGTRTGGRWAAGRPQGLRPGARQGAARKAGERRHVDNLSGVCVYGRTGASRSRSPRSGQRATASQRRSAPAGPSPSTLTDALLTWAYTTFTAFRLPSPP